MIQDAAKSSVSKDAESMAAAANGFGINVVVMAIVVAMTMLMMESQLVMGITRLEAATRSEKCRFFKKKEYGLNHEKKPVYENEYWFLFDFSPLTFSFVFSPLYIMQWNTSALSLPTANTSSSLKATTHLPLTPQSRKSLPTKQHNNITAASAVVVAVMNSTLPPVSTAAVARSPSSSPVAPRRHNTRDAKETAAF
jgi:hypothetical protein